MNLNPDYSPPDLLRWPQAPRHGVLSDAGIRADRGYPHYARFECPEGDATFSLALSDERADHGAIIYFESDRLDAWVDELIARGIEFEQPPTDMRYLWREAVVRDPCGNRIKLYHAGENRRHPPWRVEIRG